MKVSFQVNPPSGQDEMLSALRPGRDVFWMVMGFSALVNLLMMTGPIYMLNVFDRVLGARSLETLVALSVLAAFLYCCLGLLDLVRQKVMIRVSAQFQDSLDERVAMAEIAQFARSAGEGARTSGLVDLAAIRRALSSPATLAICDLPFAPLFFFALWLFHPYLGVLAISGAGLLVLIVLIQQAHGRRWTRQTARLGRIVGARQAEMCAAAEAGDRLGFGHRIPAVWQQQRLEALDAQVGSIEVHSGYAVVTRSLRLLLQSAMLGLGAFLVLENELSAGTMIASSIMFGRALAPLDSIVAHWSVLTSGREAWQRLAGFLSAIPTERPRTRLPAPTARLQVQNLSVRKGDSDGLQLHDLSFDLEPGQILGVIGPSGSGKSTLAQALAGGGGIAEGKILLDSVAIDQFGPSVLNDLIGYLPQRPALFQGSIRDNIARFRDDATDDDVVAASRLAGVHGMIVDLPQGYDTLVGSGGVGLSGGQIQQVALARTVFGNKLIWILDEPEAGLDTFGINALLAMTTKAKQERRAVVLMSQRPEAVQSCDRLLVLSDGRPAAFGAKDDILRRLLGTQSIVKPFVSRRGVA